MDPITISSLLAAAAGALGSEAIKDLYQAVKNRIKDIVGEDHDVMEALQIVEGNPKSKVGPRTLKEGLEAIDVAQDKELVKQLGRLEAILKREGVIATTSYLATQSGTGGLAQGYKPVASGAGGIAAQKIKGPITTGPNSPAFQGENITVVMGENSRTEATHQVLKAQYVKEVVRETNLLPWSQVNATYADPSKGEQLGLADIYTDLDTQELRPVEREDELRRELASQTEDRRIPALEKLNQESRLLIMGDPGSGKSTFAKHVAYLLAQSGLEDDSRPWLEQLNPWGHGVILPVWVELRELAGHAAEHEVKAGKASLVRDYLKVLLGSWSIPESWIFLEAVMKPDQAKALVVLDGLDEVPQDQRKLIVDVVNDLVRRYPQHRYVVTCRPYAYIGQPWKLQNFHHVTLAPFSEKQIERFVENWYRQLTQRKRLSEHDASWRMKQLQTQAIERKDLRGLAERPLLLTVMVQLHTFQGKLPDDRTELYNDAVDLLMERWQQRLGQETGLVQHLDIPHLKMTDLRDGLCEVAFQAHQLTSGEETPDIRESDIRQCLQTYLGGSWDKAGQFVQYIRERSGLLIPHKTDAYRFPHRTFQEFLAACYLLRTDRDPGRPASLVQQDFDRWREVFVLACGFAARKYSINKALAFINPLCPEGVSDIASPQSQHWRFTQLAADALLEVGLLGVKRERAGQVLLEHVQEWLEGAMRHQEVIVKDRVQAGRTLGLLGDRRKEVLDPIQTEFIEIPDGPFRMGEKGETVTIHVPYTYYISKFPVTQAQFQAFVDENGYQDEQYWPEAQTTGVWKTGMVQGRQDDQPRGKPEHVSEPFDLRNHPVVCVTWYEALAYCRWLTQKLRKRGDTPEHLRTLLRTGSETGKPWSITLPNEPEWEKAARGVEDARTYPWGDNADSNLANYYKTQINGTSTVGCFPKGASPYEVEEMSGNVWEWTRSVYEDEPYPIKLEEWSRREDLMADKASYRVLRGGSWFDVDNRVRCALRLGLGPGNWSIVFGFRVVVSPFSKP